MHTCSSSKKNPAKAQKACSGKCMEKCGSHGGRRWIVAACDGIIVVLEDNGGRLSPVKQGESMVSVSANGFWHMIDTALKQDRLDQLVIVGSPNDISWVHLALPHDAARKIVAEIRYPLMPAWMKQVPGMESLASAIEQVMAG